MRIFLVTLAAVCQLLVADSRLPPQIRFEPGPVNSVRIGPDIAVYSSGKAAEGVRRLLLTAARRDSIGAIGAGASLFVPSTESHLFTAPEKFWEALEEGRFHDYAQKSTKVPVRALAGVQPVEDGFEILAGDVRIRAIATPGYTAGSLSYLIEASGKRVICSGDLVYGEGQIRDLYSLQDAVPEAKARGYHGYAARAEDLIASLRKLAALKPDVLLPAHGPAITDPQKSISQLISHLQMFLRSHFETDALRWYWGDENHRIRSRAAEQPLDVMPMAEMADLPPDILPIGNSRVIVSKTGAAFVVDAGYRKLLPELKRLQESGTIRSVDGIWITHYHDDHTDFVNDVAATFGAPPIYFTGSMSEVIGNPGGFRLPCLTKRPIPVQNAKRDGETLRWNEWQFTFWNFPGQTLYHGGLVARRDDGQTYLFVGDSFTPSGMDDYCMQNRDFLRKGAGYEYCLRRISTLPSNTWLMNQHVVPMFRYTQAQMQRMHNELEKRSNVLGKLSPWPDINYMLDESWARIYPYAQVVKAGDVVRVELRVTNHAPATMTYKVRWNLPNGWDLVSSRNTATIPARSDGVIEAKIKVAGPGLEVLTADVNFGSWELPAWAEALVRVQ
ncbi:MAG TPA: MBL fold metallo-hydrolase [Bryobacteraceae bacterium]|nr:MBL fold metallo-hydrolase [Bryobacteraceae bacterium]